jgi:predicted nucleic acid-binding protein
MLAYIDTNILLDILLRRKDFLAESKEVFNQAAETLFTPLIGTYAITDIHYWLTKDVKDSRKALESIFDMLEIVNLVDTTQGDIRNAYTIDMPDFEDAVVAAIAMREKADYIITRNGKHFRNSPVPAISPGDFLNLLSNELR